MVGVLEAQGLPLLDGPTGPAIGLCQCAPVVWLAELQAGEDFADSLAYLIAGLFLPHFFVVVYRVTA